MHIVYNNTNVKRNNIMQPYMTCMIHVHSTKCILHSAYLPRTVQKIKCKYEKNINERLQTFSGQAIASYDAPISCFISLLRRIEMKWLAIFLSQ